MFGYRQGQLSRDLVEAVSALNQAHRETWQEVVGCERAAWRSVRVGREPLLNDSSGSFESPEIGVCRRTLDPFVRTGTSESVRFVHLDRHHQAEPGIGTIRNGQLSAYVLIVVPVNEQRQFGTPGPALLPAPRSTRRWLARSGSRSGSLSASRPPRTGFASRGFRRSHPVRRP